MHYDSPPPKTEPYRTVAHNAGAPITAEDERQLRSLIDRCPFVFFSHFSYSIQGQSDYAVRFLDLLCELFGRSHSATDVLLTRLVWKHENELPDVHWVIRPTRFDTRLLDRRIFELVRKAYQAALNDSHADTDPDAEDRSTVIAHLLNPIHPQAAPRKAAAQPDEATAEAPTDYRMRKIYDRNLVEQRLQEETQTHSADQRHELVKCYRKMLSGSGERVDQPSPPVSTIRSLSARFPNFAEVVDVISGAAALSSLDQSGFRLPPLLLLGPPGIGKTHFAAELARIAGLGHGVIHMETTSAGWVISGMHRGWTGATVGKVADLLVNGQCANPIMVVDEVDKASAGKYDALAPLYGLLEEKTAAAFEDECLAVPLDASGVNWILTANDLSSLPEPIRSRVTVLNIAPPTPTQLRIIVASIYRDLRESNRWGAHFDEDLSEDSIDLLTGTSPRQVRTWLRRAFGRVAETKRSSLAPTDLLATRVKSSATRTHAIGFAAPQS
jgi:ATP-dependent Lon protease